MSTPPPLAVLVITAAPDHRPSTDTLRVVLDELRRRPEVDLTVWLLRVTPEEETWPGAVIVDSLREWAPAAVLESVGVPRVPAAMRGLRRRAWNRAAHPDVVILDDRFGERVLVGTPGKPVIVWRVNETLPVHADWEPEPIASPSIVLALPGAEVRVPTGAVRIDSPHVRDYSRQRALGELAQRRRTREVLGLPADGPLVVGWGDDGWIDGPELFVRMLWSVEQRHGVAAHGLWLGLGADPHEVARLQAEAERCGVGDRLHMRSADTEAARFCGDVVFLPYRSPGEPTEILSAVSSGLAVVTFPTCPVTDPAVRVVDHLDVDAAAAQIVEALGGDRAELAASAEQRLDVGPWTSRLLEAARRHRQS